MFAYQVCGLTLSTNFPLPGLVLLPTPENGRLNSRQAQVELAVFPALEQFRQEKWYSSPSNCETGQPNLQVWHCFDRDRPDRELFYWQYGDGTEFLIQRSPLHIWANWPDSLTLEDTATYLLGPVLAFVLRLQGLLCLHASAIAIGGSAIAFVGATGAGKSTTAAAFAQCGYPVLSDDVVAIYWQEDVPWVHPAYPRLRLWPESVGFLYGDRDRLPAIVPTHPTWDKRYLDLTQAEYSFQFSSLPLSQIYLLQGRQSANAPRIEDISHREAAIALIANTSTNYLLDRDLRKAEFISLTHLLRKISVKKLYPHDDPAQLEKLVKMVLQNKI
jgi:energy-coupling factor transporter ATP-binding protein EcfA2